MLKNQFGYENIQRDEIKLEKEFDEAITAKTVQNYFSLLDAYTTE